MTPILMSIINQIIMKTLLITLILIIFSSSMRAENNPKLNFLNKNLKLSDISDKTDLTDINCDLCGCYMGLEPNFSKNSIGIRYSLFKFYTAPQAEDPELDHPESNSESTEYYNNIELFFRYYFTPKFRVIATIPYSFNVIDSLDLNGFGDIIALAQYQIYNTNMTGETNFWQRIFLGGGFKLPTGVYNKSLVYPPEVEPHFQPGTGSFDFLLSGLYIFKFEEIGLGMRNDVVFSITTENNNGYRFSNKFNLASTFTYEIDTDPIIILPHAGIYFETAGMDTQDGISVDDSGGDALFGTAGIDFFDGDYSLDFNFTFPLSQSLNGDQPQNEFRLFAGFGFAF